MRHLILLVSVLTALVFASTPALSAAPPKTLTLQIQGNGSVTLDPPGGTYERGTAVTMTATPAEGWNFDHWEGGTVDGSVSNPQVITMYNNYTVTGVFSLPSGVENIRKSDATIRVVDNQGQPVEGVSVSADMLEIDFAFGTALTPGGLNHIDYRSWVKDNYNWAVAANSAKWYANEPAQGIVSYADADDMYDFCFDNGIKMRGHTVFWSVPDYVQQWVQDLATTAELQAAVDARLDSSVPHFSGRYLHWDVNNEMLHGSFFQDRLGASIRPYMFNRVKQLDPSALTFVNEYNVISGGYSTSDYVTQISDLLAAGAQIDAVGVQGHFSGGDTMQEITQRLDAVASLGLPIWVTEFDYVDANPTARADFIEDFYRTAFGHPSVDGILMWGFWADDHWRGADAALLDSDFAVNAAGQRYQALRAEWWTNALGQSDAAGEYVFNGFYGDYQITLTGPSGSETHTVSLPRSGGANPIVELTLGTGGPVDDSAPSPDPITWAVAPTGATRDVISMAATAASDPSGVEYYFANLTDSSHDSGWQNSSVYVDYQLSPETEYTYTVTARDKSLNQNTTAASAQASATTLADDGNLIDNEGFEYGSGAGWQGFASASVKADDALSHSGIYTGKTVLRTESYDGIAQQLASKVTNGSTYQLSAWVRMVNAPSGTINATIRQTDQTGTTYFGVSSVAATDSGWTELSGTFTANYTGSLSDLTLYFEGPPAGVDYYLDTVSFLPQQPSGGGDIHVNDIAMSSSTKGPNVTATATIRIVDANGVGVPGASVNATWSGDVSSTVSGVTDGLGVVILDSPSKRNGGTFTITIDNVSLNGYTYDASANVETSDTIVAF